MTEFMPDEKKKQADISLHSSNLNCKENRSYVRFDVSQSKISKFQSLNSMKRDSLVEEFYNRGLAWQLIKKYEEARANYCRTLDIAPKFGKAHLGLGEVYLNIGQKKRAFRHLTLAKNLFSTRGDYKNIINALKLLRKISENNDKENLAGS